MMRMAGRMGKRHKEGLACIMAAVLLLVSYPVAEAAEPAANGEIAAESAEEVSAYEEGTQEDVFEEPDAVQEPEAQKPETQKEAVNKEDAGLKETVSDNSISENSISENSVSENSTETAVEVENDGLTEEESVSENTPEESVSENTPEESVSENTPEESVSENTQEGSVSENTPEESVSENTPEESVSENTPEESISANTMGAADVTALADGVSVPPTAPTIKSIVPKDTTAEVCFTYLLEGEQTAQLQYEALIRDEVKGVDLPIQSGKENGIVTISGYDGKQLNTFRIGGLASNKKYSVVLRAKYGETGEPVSSIKKIFTTKKDMISTDGSMKVHYADLEQLKNDSTKKPAEVPTTGVEMKTGESCALYAQVSRLMRAVETDKLKWTVTPLEESLKNGLKVKASKSTYEAVLTAGEPGHYQVTAVNTLSKKTVSTFQVTVW